MKEHVLVTIFANAGSIFSSGSPYAVGIINIVKPFYEREIFFFAPKIAPPTLAITVHLTLVSSEPSAAVIPRFSTLQPCPCTAPPYTFTPHCTSSLCHVHHAPPPRLANASATPWHYVITPHPCDFHQHQDWSPPFHHRKRRFRLYRKCHPCHLPLQATPHSKLHKTAPIFIITSAEGERTTLSHTYHFQVKDQIGSFFYYPSTGLHRAVGGFGGLWIFSRLLIPVPVNFGSSELVVDENTLLGHSQGSNRPVRDVQCVIHVWVFTLHCRLWVGSAATPGARLPIGRNPSLTSHLGVLHCSPHAWPPPRPLQPQQHPITQALPCTFITSAAASQVASTAMHIPKRRSRVCYFPLVTWNEPRTHLCSRGLAHHHHGWRNRQWQNHLPGWRGRTPLQRLPNRRRRELCLAIYVKEIIPWVVIQISTWLFLWISYPRQPCQPPMTQCW